MNLGKRLILAGVAAGVGGLAFWLISNNAEQQINFQTAVVQSQDELGSEILRIGLVSLPPALGNPYRGTGVPTIYTYRSMFEGLTYLTSDGRVLPRLAIAWEMIDSLTWRFELRRDVVFHNGVPFTADAVVFAVSYLTSDEGRVESVARDLGGIVGAEAVDKHAVIIRTKFPIPLLPALTESLLIVEPGQWATLGREEFTQNPIGTGPFKLIEWGQARARLAAHTESWRPPKVNFLELLAIPDVSSRVQAIMSDQADIVIGLSMDHVLDIEAAGGRKSINKSASVLGVSFVLTKLPPNHPLQDKRVRQALNYAVNKESYIQAFFGGETQPSSQPTTPSTFGYNPELKPYPYDPDRARNLLRKAGYKNGFSFTAEVTIGGGASLAPTYQRTAADLLNIGVIMTLKTIPVQQLIRNIQEGGWRGEAFGMNYSAERSGDALRSLRLHSCINRSPWYCNKRVSDLIQKALNETDIEKRRTLTKDVMATYHEEAPAIWLHEVMLFTGLGPKVKYYQEDHTLIAYDKIELMP
ncbi:MAG: ABC transporter substrate-binding protein [Rhodospirillaceae bacterium]